MTGHAQEIVTWVAAARPALSVTLAVMVCTPEDKTRENDPPVPSCPSTLDVHWIAAVRLPSCASFAEPEKVTASPEATVDLFDGLEIDTVGAVLDAPVGV